jgi:hypothetical protein
VSGDAGAICAVTAMSDAQHDLIEVVAQCPYDLVKSNRSARVAPLDSTTQLVQNPA